MPNVPPRNGGGKQIAGIDRKWWLIGGGAAVLIVYYSYRKSQQTTTTADSTIDPSTGVPYSQEYNTAAGADAGGGSSIPYNVGTSDPSGLTVGGVQPTSFGSLPAGSTVTYTAPDGSTEAVQTPIPSQGATPPENTTTTPTPIVVQKIVQAVPQTNATWMFHAEQVLPRHGYTVGAVNAALAKYLTHRPLYPHEVAIVEAATRWIGPPPNPPAIHQIPEPKRPRPKPRKRTTTH